MEWIHAPSWWNLTGIIKATHTNEIAEPQDVILLLKLLIAESLNAGVFNIVYFGDFKIMKVHVLPYSSAITLKEVQKHTQCYPLNKDGKYSNTYR